ncbi:uncharacterized protein LOC113359250 [Papaver somniferum]|uniref:uncharacterized protein LOC113359250 n=1 Tax=Papaver somniferum TaxID=3469 RepID=UPI000E6FCBAF|nr:uncharacterized protein LOC113359250 [Papaver somniferum]
MKQLQNQGHQWVPPEESYVKINVDATFIPNKGAGGAVTQDHRALPKVVIEGDAKVVSTVIFGETQDIPWSIRLVILKICNESSSFADIKFQHVPKSANYVAHGLYQFTIHDDVIFRWNVNEPPSCISSNLSFNEVVY